MRVGGVRRLWIPIVDLEEYVEALGLENMNVVEVIVLGTPPQKYPPRFHS